jgi:hypothetical protein
LAADPAFQQIIDMDLKAVPWLLRELDGNPITGSRHCTP